MNKIRCCFVFFVAIFVVIILVILFLNLPGIKNFFSPETILDQETAQENDEIEPGASGEILDFGSGNYLLLGVDERDSLKNFKGRTDTILILHLGRLGKKNLLISIPRDSRVQLEGKGWNKINAAYVYGGEEMLKDEIFQLTGLRIGRTMMVNFEGFQKLIDTLGGVEIKVDEPMHDPLSGADFEPGTYLMNGEEALAFTRFRKSAQGDFDRVDRQKYLINELIKQKFNLSIVGKSPQLIKILGEETRSDFSSLDYIKLGTILLFTRGDMERITIPGKTGTIEGISYVIVDESQVKQFLSGYLR